VEERCVLDVAPASPSPVDNRGRRRRAAMDGPPSYAPVACEPCARRRALSDLPQALASAAMAWRLDPNYST
jgi:hypothetical protein